MVCSRNTPRAFLLPLLTALLLTPAATTAAVYRCPGPEGIPRFTQFPCSGGDAVALDPLDMVRIPPISDAEQRLLDELEAERREARERREAVRRRAADQARARREARRERCEAARAARAALERQRRKGYTLSEARALDRRDSELEAQERENC